MCVGLSRAKIGLLIIGNKNMCDGSLRGKYPGQGRTAWQRLIDDHVANRAVCSREADANAPAVDALKVQHEIPSVLYELVTRH